MGMGMGIDAAGARLCSPLYAMLMSLIFTL